MVVKHKRHFGLGIVLAVAFLAVLFLMFSPIFGEGRNGLEFADDMFNKLSKGSSYFIPRVSKSNEKFIGKMFTAGIKFDKPEEAEKVAKLFITAGAKVEIQGAELKIEGDLGKILNAVLKDADAMYQNDGVKVSSLYGYDEKDVLKTWWKALGKIDKAFKKEHKIEDAKIVSDINKKAVETAHNFYKIEAVKVKDKAALMTFLLVFYVAYTMWWGFAIFYLFEGMGLSMKKAKVKKEV